MVVVVVARFDESPGCIIIIVASGRGPARRSEVKGWGAVDAYEIKQLKKKRG